MLEILSSVSRSEAESFMDVPIILIVTSRFGTDHCLSIARIVIRLTSLKKLRNGMVVRYFVTTMIVTTCEAKNLQLRRNE